MRSPRMKQNSDRWRCNRKWEWTFRRLDACELPHLQVKVDSMRMRNAATMNSARANARSKISDQHLPQSLIELRLEPVNTRGVCSEMDKLKTDIFAAKAGTWLSAKSHKTKVKSKNSLADIRELCPKIRFDYYDITFVKVSSECRHAVMSLSLNFAHDSHFEKQWSHSTLDLNKWRRWWWLCRRQQSIDLRISMKSENRF